MYMHTIDRIECRDSRELNTKDHRCTSMHVIEVSICRIDYIATYVVTLRRLILYNMYNLILRNTRATVHVAIDTTPPSKTKNQKIIQ